jgi:hypothetical protein
MDIRELLRRIAEFLRSIFRGLRIRERRDPSALLHLDSSAHVDTVDEEGNGCGLTLTVTVGAFEGGSASLVRAISLLCHTGGWVQGAIDHLQDHPGEVSGRFFDMPEPLPGGMTHTSSLTLPCSGFPPRSPTTHVVHSLKAVNAPVSFPGHPDLLSLARSQSLTVVTPSMIDGATDWSSWSGWALPTLANAAPVPVNFPFQATLVGSVDVFNVSHFDAGGAFQSGTPFITVLGQLITLSGEVPEIQEIHLEIKDDAGLVTGDTLFTIRDAMGSHRSNEFVRNADADPILGIFYLSHAIDPASHPAVVQITVTHRIDGGAGQTFKRTEPLRVGDAQPILAPVKTPADFPGSVWKWDAGPADPVINRHNPSTWTRYTYDLGFMDAAGGELEVLADGSRADNTRRQNFLIWNQPLYAVAAGRVHFIREDVPEHNSGRDGQPGYVNTQPPGGNVLILRHDGIRGENGEPHFSLYAHMKTNSASDAGLSVGMEVAEGRHIGNIGNSGNTGGPHLHFTYFTFEDGRTRAVAPRFKNLALVDGTAVISVPQSGLRCQAV